jgi:hypothetical protein
MNDQEAEASALPRPVFPYHAIWPGFGNANVTIGNLEAHEAEFRNLQDRAHQRSSTVRVISLASINELLARHCIAREFSTRLWLIASFYLSPEHLAAAGEDPGRERAALVNAANAATRLSVAMSKIAPEVMASLCILRPAVEEVFIRKEIPFDVLRLELRDFCRVALAAATDLSVSEGRPRNHIQDASIRLLIELCAAAGLNDLRVSAGTGKRPTPHLVGTCGELLRDFFKLVEPRRTEESLAPIIKRVRAAMRRGSNR